MNNPGTIDIRLQKISNLLDRYLVGDFSVRESFQENGDEIDGVIKLINELGAKVQRSGQLIADYENRVTAIMNILLKYTFFDFSEKAAISSLGDEIDAIALALNTLGEELNDRILAEKTHTAELEKLAVVIETTADAVASLTPEGLVTHWNKSAERIYGYSAEEVMHKNASIEFAPSEEKENVQLMLQKVNRGEQIINAHSKRVRKDGKTIDISITMTPILNSEGKVISISALSRDITEQKKAEQALRENEERFRSLVEGVKDYAIITLDPDGKITSWNKGAEDMQGYKTEEVLGKHFSLFSSQQDRAEKTPDAILKDAREQGKANFEGWRLRKDGSAFWGYVVLTCLHDSNDKVIGYSKITRDLTETKRKDDEIRKTNLTLEQKNFELERMNKELASFAYVSSHDLQEPLRKIQTFASRVLETDFENLSNQGKDYFRRLNSSANRMQQLILDILDYSKVSTADSKKEAFKLETLLLEVKEEFKDVLEEKNAELKISKIGTVPIIRYQFKQLVNNLISNALKFSDPKRKPVITIKGKTVSYKDLPQKIAHQKEKYCYITISDNGIGFEPHFSAQIFEVFQRLHNQEIYKGTGIGLAICKKIAENHNGLITASGELGIGATFHLYLPLD